MKKRIATLMASVLAFSTLASCGGSAGTGESTTASGSGETTADTAPAETTFAPLEEKNYGGKDFTILMRTGFIHEFQVEEETGDTVSDAIYRRNSTVEDKYGVALKYIDMKGDWSVHDAFANTIHNSVLAADGEYDLIMHYQAVVPQNIVSGDLLDLNSVPHLTLDAPWWLQEGVEALTYNGKTFMACGDLSLSMLEGINCMFFNKSVADDYDTPDLYELARSGKWTHDAMNEVTKDLFIDLNNDGKRDEGDSFGLVSRKGFIRSYLVTYDTPTMDAKGNLIWYTERTVSVLEKLVDFYASNDNFYVAADKDAQKIFSEGRALLMNATFGQASMLRSMDDDFGIIPFPKFDEEQEYKTPISNETSMICIPITAKDVEMSGFIAEALCRESTDTVANAFYNVALQGKYARDGESLEMIELIRGTLNFDFCWVHSHIIGDPNVIGITGARYETMVIAEDKNFASWWAANEATYTEAVATMLESYN